MRSIRISLVLLAMVAVFCTANCVYVQGRLSEIAETAERLDLSLPPEEQLPLLDDLRRKWDALFPYMTYVASYTELNRADEAVQELWAAGCSGSRENAASAAARLLDDLRRIRELEGVSLHAIF